MHGGLAMTKRFPEIAPQGTLEETSVLDYPRIVEAHCRPKTRHVLGRRVGRQEQRRRVTGQVQDHEHDDGYAEEDQDGLPQPPQHVGFHLTAGASKWPPHSPRLAPARHRRARTASVLVFMHLPYRLPSKSPPHSPRLAPARPHRARTASVLVFMHLPDRLPLEIAPAGAAAAMGEIRRHAA